MEEALDTWLNRQMQQRGIRSIYRLAHELGLETSRVGDWLLGRSVPQEYEVGMLAAFFGVLEQTIRSMSDSMLTRNSYEPRNPWLADRSTRRARLPISARPRVGVASSPYPNSYYLTTRRGY